MKDRMGKLEKKDMEINKEGKNSTEKYQANKGDPQEARPMPLKSRS